MAKKDESRSFEEAMAELEKIVKAIEGGQVPLAESLAQYEKGIELISHCQKTLSAAEQKIARLSKGLDGQLKLENAQELSEDQDAQASG